MIQDLLVYLIVAAAVGYLVRMWWQAAAGKKGSGCGSSGGCAKATTSTRAGQAPSSSGLIQINLNGSSLNGTHRKAEKETEHRPFTTDH